MAKFDKCPTCFQQVRRRKLRLCYACKKQITTGDKFFFELKGDYSAIRHRNCDYPQSYKPTPKQEE